jgi:hypothetical protein
MLDTLGKGNASFPIAASAIIMRNEQISVLFFFFDNYEFLWSTVGTNDGH